MSFLIDNIYPSTCTLPDYFFQTAISLENSHEKNSKLKENIWRKEEKSHWDFQK